MKESEHDIQSTFFQLVSRKAVSDRRWNNIFAIPNGARMSMSQANKMKREGLKRGVPDVFVAYPSKLAHGLFLEFKSKGRYPEKEQREWMARLKSAGFDCAIVRDPIEAAEIVSKHLEGGE